MKLTLDISKGKSLGSNFIIVVYDSSCSSLFSVSFVSVSFSILLVICKEGQEGRGQLPRNRYSKVKPVKETV